MVKNSKDEVIDSLAYYKPCVKDGKRELMWRIELGTQLVAQMDPVGFASKLYCLKSLPEGYALFDRYNHRVAGVSASASYSIDRFGWWYCRTS